MSGYSDSKTPSQPPIERTDVYKTPAAARFGRGASNLAEIKQATDMRRAHNEALSNSFCWSANVRETRFQMTLQQIMSRAIDLGEWADAFCRQKP
jgi:hypothetical protein